MAQGFFGRSQPGKTPVRAFQVKYRVSDLLSLNPVTP
eukprot:gene13223-16128_t